MGYGDYTPGTTTEYLVVLFMELGGIAVFAMLQMTVTRVVTSDYSYKSYVEGKQDEIYMWLVKLQKSCFPYYMSPYMSKMW